MTSKSKSPDPKSTVETAAKKPSQPRRKAAAPAADISLPSITARLLAIAAMGEANGAGPMLSLARAALMDAARLNGLVGDGKAAGPTLEDLIGRLDTEGEAEHGDKPGDVATPAD